MVTVESASPCTILHHGCTDLLAKKLPASENVKEQQQKKSLAFHTEPLYAAVVTDT